MSVKNVQAIINGQTYTLMLNGKQQVYKRIAGYNHSFCDG